MLLAHSITLRSCSPGRDNQHSERCSPFVAGEDWTSQDAGDLCEEMALLIAQLRNSSALLFFEPEEADGEKGDCWLQSPTVSPGQACQKPPSLGQREKRKLPASGGLKDRANNGKGM